MFPLGHALFGYLLYVLFAWTFRRQQPHGVALGALLVGTQFPDLVDKPLAFVDILASGRSLAHSLFFAVGLLALLWLVTRRYGHSHLTTAFGFGHVTHLVGDVISPALGGRFGELTFLLWPVLPAPEYAAENIAPWIRIVRYYSSPEPSPELVLIPVAIAVFVLVELRRRWVLAR